MGDFGFGGRLGVKISRKKVLKKVFKRVKGIMTQPISVAEGVLSEAAYITKKVLNSNPVTGSIRSMLNKQLKFTIGALNYVTDKNRIAGLLSRTGLASKNTFRDILTVAEVGLNVATDGLYSAGKAAMNQVGKVASGNMNGAVSGFIAAAASSAAAGKLSSVVGSEKAQAISAALEQVQDSKDKLAQFADAFDSATKEPAYALANYGGNRIRQAANSALSISSGYSENLGDLQQLQAQRQAFEDQGRTQEYDDFVEEILVEQPETEITLDEKVQRERRNDALQFLQTS